MGFSLSLPLPPLPGISFSSGEKKQVNQTNITNNFYNNTGGNTMGGGNGGFMDAFNSLDQAASGGSFAFASAGPNGSSAIAGSFGTPQQGQQANNPLLANKQFGAFLEKVGGDLKDDGILNKSNQQQQNPMQKIMQMMMGMMQMMMGMMGGQGQGQDQNNPLQMLGLS